MNTKNNNYFKVPALQKDGSLLNSDAMAIYHYYLATERMDFEGVMKKPCRSAVLKAFLKKEEEENKDVTSFVHQHLKEGKRILFWSDQHFYHKNIIRFSNRPYENVDHMNNSMIATYFDIVKEDDLVIWGGDVSFDDVELSQNLLQNLPGKKILVLGNHDFDGNKMLYRDYGIFDFITMGFVFQQKIEKDIANFIVTHYPIENKYLPPNTINIHGHLHFYDADKKNINISVEKTNYQPIDLTEKVEILFKEIKK